MNGVLTLQLPETAVLGIPVLGKQTGIAKFGCLDASEKCTVHYKGRQILELALKMLKMH